ncbi:MAG: hypothetical protein ACI9UA_002047 [Pseudoalteromonas tetraodonis]|jgi:hypothetical protein
MKRALTFQFKTTSQVRKHFHRFIFFALSFAVVFSTFLGTAEAVVIASGDGSGNTSAPGDDPEFANVGVMGSGGAVYLSNRWILTVAHLSTGGGVAAFGGTNYNFVSATSTRLSNAPGSGLTGLVDLRMIRLDADPGLPAVTIASAAPTVSENLVMVGRGNLRDTTGTDWTIDTAPDPDVWTAGGADTSGYFANGSRMIRWGENQVLDCRSCCGVAARTFYELG